MTKTSIEWAEEVWNPVTGCTKISAGCKNCYAEKIANRFWSAQYPPIVSGVPRKFTDVRLHCERLNEPSKWKNPRRVFVNSMSDIFHKDVTRLSISNIWNTMQRHPQHTFIVLTKRADRMRDVLNDWTKGRSVEHWPDWPLPNVWVGVSVEDQKAADERIPALLDTPAAVRFISVEPMLGPVEVIDNCYGHCVVDDCYYCPRDKKNVDWVICGCESGPGRRPMSLDWARSLRDQCQDAGVPFFFKQAEIGGKLIKMPELDGRVWGEYPGGER